MKGPVMGLMTCAVCGRDFPLIAEEQYIVKDNEKTGISAAIGGYESKLYDAFDCPHCGCQNVVQERKRIYNPMKDYEIADEFESEDNEEKEEE